MAKRNSSSKAGRTAGRKGAPSRQAGAPARQEWQGVPATQVYRYLGGIGANGAEAMAVAKRLRLKPNHNTAYSQVGAGRNRTRGGRPELREDLAGKLKATLQAVKESGSK